MRLLTCRSVSAASLAVALVLLPGAGRAEPGQHPPATRTTSAPATRTTGTPATPTTGITVTMYCTSDSISCEAAASGGSGGYSFVWTNAEEGYTEGNYSEAAPQCWSGHNKFTVSVLVTDSLGATGTASKYFVCP